MGIFGDVLGVVAPALASALPGPLGSIAKKFVTDALGIDAATPDQEIQKQLAVASPEILARIKAADQQFAIQMKQLDIDLEKVYATDRGSAREMYEKVRDLTTPALAWTYTIGFFALMAYLFRYGMPTGMPEVIAGSLLGTLGTLQITIITFYFGSSSGSAAKSATIDAAIKKQ